MEGIKIESTPLLQPAQHSETINETTQKSRSIGQIILDFLARFFSCFRSSANDHSHAATVSTVDQKVEPQQQYLRVEAFNTSGTKHQPFQGFFEVTNKEGRSQGKGPLHELSDQYPWASTWSMEGPETLDIHIESRGKVFETTVGPIKKSAVLEIKEVAKDHFIYAVRAWQSEKYLVQPRDIREVKS